MAKHVRISTIGAQQYMIEKPQSYQDAVDKIIAHWQKELDQVLPDKPDLIVLPEVCDRPANYNNSVEQIAAYRQTRGRQVQDFMAGVALKYHCYIAYCAERDAGDGTFRNSTILIDRRGGMAGIYNKNHLTIEANTQGNMIYGKDAALIQTDFGRVACAICFDLNFDELRLKYAAAKPDLVIFSSMYHGGLMQAYWAYSCRAYFVSAIAGPAVRSNIISPIGEPVATTTNYFDFVTATVNLDYCQAHLDYNWEKLTALKAKYGPGVTITDPGYLGSVLITSETDACSAKAMAREFKIELLDDYFHRALAHRHAPGHIEA